MKTTRNFLFALLGLALAASFLVQNNVQTKSLNQASLISFADETIPLPIPETNVSTNSNTKNVLILPGVKEGDHYIPHITLPEVKIEDKFNNKNLYPAVKVDGKYIPHMQLQEVKIKAN